MRKTKIVCTIGPASENEEILTQMCLAGMNVARLNFSHGTHPEHEKKIELVKRVREKLNLPIAILLDTKGPEYRIKTFAAGKAEIREGQDFTFTVDEIEGDETRVSVNYKLLNKDLSAALQKLQSIHPKDPWVAVALRNATDENRRKRILWRFARHPMISLRMLKHKKCRKPKQIPCEEADLARLASLLAEN